MTPDLRWRTPFRMTFAGRRVDELEQVVAAHPRGRSLVNPPTRVRLHGTRLRAWSRDRGAYTTDPMLRGELTNTADGVQLDGNLYWTALLYQLVGSLWLAGCALVGAVLQTVRALGGHDDDWPWAVGFAALAVFLVVRLVRRGWFARDRHDDEVKLRLELEALFGRPL